MNPHDPNVILLELVAHRLGEELRRELVFVGGAIVGLLITDPALPGIRATDDVDLIVRAAALTDYHKIERALAARGFVQDMNTDAPICRWRVASVLVDVMPTLQTILGFSNRWYPLALESAAIIALPSGMQIRMISAPAFLATKLEAFAGRGNDDFLFSHDLADVIAVIDGRAALLAECQHADSTLRLYLSERISRLLASRRFLEALPGHLPADAASRARLPDLIDKLRVLVALGTHDGQSL